MVGRKEGRGKKSLRGLLILDSFLVFLCPAPTRCSLPGTPFGFIFKMCTESKHFLRPPLHPARFQLSSPLIRMAGLPAFGLVSLQIIFSEHCNLPKEKSQCMPCFFLQLPVTSHVSPKTKAKTLPVDSKPLPDLQAHSLQTLLASLQFSQLSSHTLNLGHSQRLLPLLGLLFPGIFG